MAVELQVQSRHLIIFNQYPERVDMLDIHDLIVEQVLEIHKHPMT